ncbi:hypothetical protein O7602_09965 [Micromonospora sp. WMMD1128]|uniref:hypothetical protein n=1 Tax=unclassified Micromonospora TaxID=2617518 RepID=UPI00248BB986|nr:MULTISPECIES: hypothetical protein [unclassified Micromonospora]WBB75803.1 hypothetical protein O7602_09965 [Micromonospora sp. WMMD1128]WFE36407.1 hypothetical protein O7613_13750 [Micromonospora sp. WMMD975]
MPTSTEPAGRRARRLASGLLVVAAVLTTVTAASAPATAEPVGLPVLRQVDLGEPGAVLVVPGRPGRNLVRVPAEGWSVGATPDRLVPATTRPGTEGAWAAVELAAGHRQLWVGRAGRTMALTVPVGTGPRAPDELTGPDGPECATAELGRLAAGRPAPVTTCPAQRLGVPDRSALVAAVRFIAGRAVDTITVIGDESPRSREATAAVTAEAGRQGITVSPTGRGPLVIVAGWDLARRTLADVSAGRRTAPFGAYLAPWLLHGPVLDQPVGQVLALAFGPIEPGPQRYLGALGALAPGVPPSAGGYQAYLEATGGHLTGPVRLYAAARLTVPGSMPGHAGHHGTAWLPGGTVTPVTRGLDAG